MYIQILDADALAGIAKPTRALVLNSVLLLMNAEAIFGITKRPAGHFGTMVLMFSR